MGVPAWYFVLFVSMGGGFAGVDSASRSRSDAFFYPTKAACERVLGQIRANGSKGNPFHRLLLHKDYDGVHKHSWNKSCRRVPNRV